MATEETQALIASIQESLETIISEEDYALDDDAVENLPGYLEQEFGLTKISIECTLEGEEEEEVQLLSLSATSEDGELIEFYASINEAEETVEFGELGDETEDEEEDYDDDFDDEDEDEDEDSEDEDDPEDEDSDDEDDD